MPEIEYYIEGGVRRAVAARELGVEKIPAKIHIEGQPPQEVMIELSRLYSPKSEIVDDRRYQKVFRLISDPLGIEKLAEFAPIEVQILRGVRNQPKSIPLHEVKLIQE